MRASVRARSAWLPLLLLLGVLDCKSSPVQPPADATLVLEADVSGTSVITVVAEVTAADIPTPLVFNIPVLNGVAGGTIVVPAGSSRSFAMRAYDAGGVETHSGSKVLTIQPGANATVTMILQPLTGELPISVTLGSMSVTVTPSTLPLIVGATGPLSAAIKDWNGQDVNATVKWATQDPGVATVDDAGLVTAQGPGVTKIVATYQGAAGNAVITVSP